MKTAFAYTANVRAFMKGVEAAQGRGAAEAGIVLVTGEAGFGKTRTVHWWGGENGAVYVRAKAAYTAHWFYTDLCAALGIKPPRSTEDLNALVTRTLMQRGQPALIVDEVEHCLRDGSVIESIRDVVDLCELPTVLVGMEGVLQRLRRLPQIVSRTAATVVFGPATRDDVRIVCDATSEVKIADDLVAEIHRLSAGRMREIMNAIAVAERVGKRAGRPVALADLPPSVKLVNDGGGLLADMARRAAKPGAAEQKAKAA